MGLLAGLNGWLGLPALAANTLSYSAGIVNGYLLNRRWTYGDRPHPRRAAGAQFAQFVMVSLVALLINNVVVLSLTPPLSALLSSTYGLLLAKAAAVGVCLGWNFLLNHFWTFRAETALKGIEP
jgi:putative flippase GtrA